MDMSANYNSPNITHNTVQTFYKIW
jgi:hypothetical protein